MKSALQILCFAIILYLPMKGMAHGGPGVDWSYSSTATKGIYHVRLSLYIDCVGLPPCSGSCDNYSCFTQISINSADVNNTNLGTADLQLTAVSQSTYGLCPEASTVCTDRGCKTAGTLTPGFEKYTFEGDVDLRTTLTIPASLCAIRLSFFFSPRHSTINTGMAGEDLYSELIINRCNAINNNSPIFNNDLKLIACAGQPLIYNNAATDAEFDSLSYSFAPALTAPGQSATYIPPYSAASPLPWSGPVNGTFPAGIKCDPVTGDIMFTPVSGGTGPFIGVMVIEIKEWRKINGVPQLLSVIRREQEMYIMSCQNLSGSGRMSNNAPRVLTNPSGPGNQPQTKWEVNAGNTLCFDIIAKDTDFSPPGISDTTYLTWLANLPGATFTPNYIPSNRTTTGPREDTYKFCWTPDDSLALNYPYYFYVSANDDVCPFTGNMSRTFQVLVYSSKAKVTIKKESISCGKWKLSYTKKDTSQVFKAITWKVSKEPNDFTFSQGYYTYSNVTNLPPLDFSKKGKYIIELDITLPAAVGTSNISVIRDTLQLDSMAFVIAPQDTFICAPGPSSLVFESSSIPSDAQIKWYLLPDRNTYISDSAQLKISNFSGSRTYLIKASDALSGCVAYDSFTVVIDYPSAQFTMSRDSICDRDTAIFSKTSPYVSSSLSYSWRTGDGHQYDDYDKIDLSHNYALPGQYDVTLVVNNLNVCRDSITQHVSVLPKPVAAFVASKDSQCISTPFQFSNQSSNTNNNTIYTWNTGDSNSFNQSGLTYSYQAAGTYTVQLTAFSVPGCESKVSHAITVFPKPAVSFSIQRDSLCKMTSFSLQNTSSGALSYAWDMGDGNTYTQANPMHQYAAVGEYHIQLAATSEFGCQDFMSKTVFVSPNPIALFSFNKNAVCVNDPLILTNQSAVQTNTYTSKWYMGDGTMATTKNFTHIYQDAGEYKVQLFVTNAYKCTDSIDYTFKVWPRPSAPVISGDTSAIQHTTKTYSVPFRSNSSWQWFIYGDSAHSGTNNVVNVTWGYKPEGGSVKVLEANEHGCNSDTSSLSVHLTAVNGVPEVNYLNAIQWYPVPARDVLYFSSSAIQIDHIRLYNLEGKELMDFLQEDILKRELPFKNISSGIYLLKLESNGNTVTKKISIVK